MSRTTHLARRSSRRTRDGVWGHLIADQRGQFIVRQAAAQAPEPGEGVLFAADFAAAKYPDYDFDGFWELDDLEFWTLTARSGVGPGGIDAAEIECIDGGVNPDNQFGFGWSVANVGLPAHGDTRYLRMWFKLLTPVNLARQPTGGPWGDKMVIWGQGGADQNDRMMWNLREWEGVAPHEEPAFVLEKNIDGNGGPDGDTRIETAFLTPDVWIKAQWKIRFSSDPDTFDGKHWLYLDGDNASESTPTYTSGDWRQTVANMADNIILGGYADTAFTPSAIKFQFCRFEYADTFDPTWGD